MQATAIMGLVRRLLTLETAESQDQSVTGAAERVSDKLRAHLCTRIGQEGFRTLLARALTLTIALFPHMKAVRVGGDGSLIGLRVAAGPSSQQIEEIGQTQDNVTPQDAVEGVVALLSHLLGLLVAFIGEDLTLRILSTVSPRLALTELASDAATGGENETP